MSSSRDMRTQLNCVLILSGRQLITKETFQMLYPTPTLSSFRRLQNAGAAGDSDASDSFSCPVPFQPCALCCVLSLAASPLA
mmetsp:Transcript_27373/g.83238  ORF Transcript_27373/g.83238 Transcript_27373/m.83238 type:complete len:82 (+) Transcript_27373:1137-1382(+)